VADLITSAGQSEWPAFGISVPPGRFAMLQLLQRAKDPNEEESGAGFPNDADDFVAPIPVLKKVIEVRP